MLYDNHLHRQTRVNSHRKVMENKKDNQKKKSLIHRSQEQA